MTDAYIWTIAAALGAVTYLTRFAFLGLVGDRKLPDWALRHLRYVGAAVLPGMVAPLLVWPQANAGEPDVLWIVAAGVALAVGAWRREPVLAAAAGAATLAALSWAGL